MKVVHDNEDSYTIQCEKCFNRMEIKKDRCKISSDGKILKSYVLCNSCRDYQEEIKYENNPNTDKFQSQSKKRKLFALLGLAAIVVIVFTIIVSNNSKMKAYENEYISKAQEVVSEYNLKDAHVYLKYRGKYSGYRQYDLSVESSSFENLESNKKFDFVKSIDKIWVNDSNLLVLRQVVSNENNYKIDVLYDNVLNRNSTEYYVNGTKQKKDYGGDTPSSNTTYEKEPSDDDKGYAWAAAIREVKERLKAPSTAKFPFSYYGQYIKEVDTKTFVVKSYVDAENSFGAKIRSNFMVKIKRTGENTYNVLDVQIYE